MGGLSHLSALIRVEKNVIDVEGRGHQRLLVGDGHRLGPGSLVEGLDRPETLADGADVQVDLDFVILYFTFTPPFGVFIGILIIDQQYNLREQEPGNRLYLKPSLRLIQSLRPITI